MIGGNMNPTHRLLLVLVLVFGTWLSGLAAQPPALALAQQADSGVRISASAGFENFYKDNQWMPVRVRVENDGPDVSGEIAVKLVQSNQVGAVYKYPLDLPSVARKVVTVYVRPSQTFSLTLDISFSSQGKELTKTRLQMNSLGLNDTLVGVLAENSSSYNVLSQTAPANGTATVAVISPDQIPDAPQGLAALDLLVFSGVDSGELSPAQRQALVEWTAWGGRLIITGGAAWQQSSFGFVENELIPIRVQGSETLRETDLASALEQIQAYASSPEGFTTTEGLVIAFGTLNPGAAVLLSAPIEGGSALPLVVSKRYGAGEVVFLAFDPSQPPLRAWSGSEDFYRILLSAPLPQPAWNGGILDWGMAVQAAQTLPSLELPSVLLICGFLFVYLGTLGPLNFLLLRLIKRRELGWITIPASVIFFSIVVFIGGSLSRGQLPILNRLSVVQSWPGVPQARAFGVVGLYSPGRDAYRLGAAGSSLLNTIDLGFPSSNTPSAELIQDGSTFEIADVQVDVGGVAAFGYEGASPAPEFAQDLVITINENGSKLSGTLENRSSLALEDAVLLSMTNVVTLGAIEPGQSLPIDQPLDFAQTGNPILGPGGLKPAPGFTAPSLTYQPVNIIEQILGTYNYYEDRDTFRKYSLLVAAMSYSPNLLSQTGEIYLVGWTKQPVAQVELVGEAFQSEDVSLFILGIEPPVEYEGNQWTLTPGFFTSSPLDPNQTDISPYNLYLYYPVNYTLVFTPRQKLDFSRVVSLEFHLYDPGRSSSPVDQITCSLWNFRTGAWDVLDDLIWSDNLIPNPEDYVAPANGVDDLGTYLAGTIRLQVDSDNQYLEINTSDFSVVVER
jgi:hypothetical protein